MQRWRWFSLVRVIALSVTLLSFSAGTTMTWTSPVLPKLINHTDDFFEWPLNDDESTWISSLLTLGAAAGTLIYGWLANLCGRRICLLSTAVLQILGFGFMSTINSVGIYYLARFLNGIATAGIYLITSLYMMELVSKSERGRLSGLTNATSVLGIVYTYSVGPYISIRSFNMSLLVFPLVFLIIFIIFGVETAHFHVMRSNKHKARIILEKTRYDTDDVDKELEDIIEKSEEIRHRNWFHVMKLRSTKIGFINAFGLFFFQSFTGVMAIQFYSQQIFSMTGSSIAPEICSIIIGSLQFLSGFTTSLLMERFNRKTLLYSSAFVMASSIIPLGVYCLKKNVLDTEILRYLPILAMSVFILAYNSGFGPLPFMIPSEIFSSNIKSSAVSLVHFVYWIQTFFIAKYFQDLIRAFGIGYLFIIFGIFCLISVIFVKYFVVETMGKSLEQIQDELNGNNNRR